MKRFLSILIPVCFFWSCGPQDRVSKDVFDKVNRSMEAKKLSEAQITQEAMIWGDSISSEAQQQFLMSLHKAVEVKGLSEALEFCNVSESPISKALSEKGILIRRTSAHARNSKNLPDEEELPILDAYQYNTENGIENEPNIQKINGGEVLLYTKAIVISSEFCLSCHGDPAHDIKEEVLNTIDSLYPEDLARNLKVGNLKGMWSIRLPKKSVVNKL